jgi:poly [ADP-ribose] polymerase
MFGYGIYFADKAQKSIGYCSLQGSYWAHGSDRKGFLSLYEVHLGSFLKIKHHESWCYDLNKQNLRKRGSFDSLFAEGGADLRNNEYIVYDDSQCTIKFLVEIG